MTEPTPLSRALAEHLPKYVTRDVRPLIHTPGSRLESALRMVAHGLWPIPKNVVPYHSLRCLLLARLMELGGLPRDCDDLMHIGIDGACFQHRFPDGATELVLVPLVGATDTLDAERRTPLRRHALQAIIWTMGSLITRFPEARLERLAPAREALLAEALRLLNTVKRKTTRVYLPKLSGNIALPTSDLIRVVLDLGGLEHVEPFLDRLAWGEPHRGRLVLDALSEEARDALLSDPETWPLLRTFAGDYPNEARFTALLDRMEAEAKRNRNPNAPKHFTSADLSSPEAQRALLNHLGDTPERFMGAWAMALNAPKATPHPRFARAFAALWIERIDAHRPTLAFALERDHWLPTPQYRTTRPDLESHGFYSSAWAMRTWPDEAVAPAFDAFLALPVEHWAFCAACTSLAHRALGGVGQDAPTRAAAALKRLQNARDEAGGAVAPRVATALAHAHMAAHHGPPDWEAYAAAFDGWIDHGTFPDALAPQTHARRSWLERLRERFLNARANPNRDTVRALGWRALARDAGAEPWSALAVACFLGEPGAKGGLYEERFAKHAAAWPALRAATRAILRTQRLRAWTKALYDVICAHPAPDDLAIHTRVLWRGSKTLAEAARWQLVEIGEDAVEALVAGLNAAKKARLATAQCLERIASPDALPALEQRLPYERDADVKAALNAAIDACDPRVSVRASGFDAGIYPATAPSPDANLALAHLRDAVYAEPSHAAWTRLCDAVERCRRVGALDIALDCTYPVLDRWPIELRALPLCWNDIPELRGMCSAPIPRADWAWMPVSALHDTDHIRAALDLANGRCRTRLLTPDRCADFLPLLERAWQWCQDHQLPVTALTLRLDGGAKSGINATSTTMTLRHGFGASFSRLSAVRQGSHTAAVQRLNVTIPSDRLDLRDHYQLSARKRTLDLLPLLSDAAP